MSGVNADGYTADQQQQLDLAKRKHRETTDSAQRALQVDAVSSVKPLA